MSDVLDFAWTFPPEGVLRASGGAIMYLSNDSSKNASGDRITRLQQLGVPYGLIWETTNGRMNDGGDAGQSDATRALAQARALGWPEDRPIYFAQDIADTVGPKIQAYLHAVASVIGPDRVGVYGGIDVVSECLNQGLCRFGWQTSAWSGGRWEARAHLHQYNYTAGWDFNTPNIADWGGTSTGSAPAGNGHPDLRVGSKGADVARLQSLLGVAADGDFGPITDAAVRGFQAAHGLQVDGEVGPITWAALDSGTPPVVVSAPPPSGVTTVQQVLDVAGSQDGYVEGPNNANKFGSWYGADNVPWCAEYVSWVLYTAFHANGQASPLEGVQNDKGSAYCPFIVNWARTKGVASDTPLPGRLVLFDWNKDGVSDHIGICTSAEDGNGNYTTLEGNTSPADNSNGGQVMRRTRSNHQGYSMLFADLFAGQPQPAAAAPAPVSAPTAPGWPGRVLMLTSPYMRGGDVSQWQQQMVARGWHLDVDGVFGHQSRSAALAFQQDKGLLADGEVGPVTWAATWTAPVTP